MVPAGFTVKATVDVVVSSLGIVQLTPPAELRLASKLGPHVAPPVRVGPLDTTTVESRMTTVWSVPGSVAGFVTVTFHSTRLGLVTVTGAVPPPASVLVMLGWPHFVRSAAMGYEPPSALPIEVPVLLMPTQALAVLVDAIDG